MAETELERAEKRFAQAKARLQGLRNREATRLRKMDTRRKVILGGALIIAAGLYTVIRQARLGMTPSLPAAGNVEAVEAVPMETDTEKGRDT